MAGNTSAWTTKGSNLDGVDDGDALSGGYINPTDNGVGETSGTAASTTRTMDNVHMRHECHMWLDDTAAIDTNPFNWPINGDLTIAFNVTDLDLAGSIGNCTAQVMGSVDGTNYVELKALGTTTFDDAMVAYVYDYDAQGRMPYMKLRVTPASDVDNTATPIKIVVINH